MANPCDIWFRIFVIVFILISFGTFVWLVCSLIFSTFFKGGNVWNDYQENKIEQLKQKLSECNDENNI